MCPLFPFPLPEKQLSSEEEHELAVIIKNKPNTPEAEAAIEKLVLHNIKFAIFEANKIWPEDADLQQEMLIGLWQAAQRIDPSFQNRLISFAKWRMKPRRNRHIAKYSKQVSLPTRFVEQGRIMPIQVPLDRSAAHNSQSKLGDRIDLATGRIDDGSDAMSFLESSEAKEKGLQYVDKHHARTLEDSAIISKVNSLAREAMHALQFRARRIQVMEAYFTMLESGEVTFTILAAKIGDITRQRCEQIVNTSLPMIRNYLLQKDPALFHEALELCR